MPLYRFLCLSLVGLLLSCESPPQQEAVPEYTLFHAGTLRQIMQAGDLSMQASLDTVAGVPGTYALGATTGLKGEIVVWDGEPFIAQHIVGVTMITQDSSAAAALLVGARVSQWQSVALPDTVASQAQFEVWLPRVAQDRGLPREGAFPFRLEGIAPAIDWHVIDWPEGDAVHTHEKHRTSGSHGTWEGHSVQLLGFYSMRHTGIFTHHLSPLHMHARSLTEYGGMGHVDRLVPGRSLTLWLPR